MPLYSMHSLTEGLEDHQEPRSGTPPNEINSSDLAARIALSKEDVLESLCSVLGPGLWLLIAPIAKLWRTHASMYESVTGLRACVSSTSVYQHARAAGLPDDHQAVLGQHGAEEVVQRFNDPVSLKFWQGLVTSDRAHLLQSIGFVHFAIIPQNSKKLICAALRAGSLQCLALFEESRIPFRTSSAVTFSLAAAEGGSVPSLEWLKQRQLLAEPQSGVSLTGAAAAADKASALDWLYAQGHVVTSSLMTHAARNGSTDLLVWGLSHGCTVAAVDLTVAASRGHLDWLKHIHGNHSSAWQIANVESMLQSAGANGQLPVVQWLFETFSPPLPADMWDLSRCW